MRLVDRPVRIRPHGHVEIAGDAGGQRHRERAIVTVSHLQDAVVSGVPQQDIAPVRIRPIPILAQPDGVIPRSGIGGPSSKIGHHIAHRDRRAIEGLRWRRNVADHQVRRRDRGRIDGDRQHVIVRSHIRPLIHHLPVIGHEDQVGVTRDPLGQPVIGQSRVALPGGERLSIGAGAEQSVAGIELIVKGKINCVSPLRTTDRGCRNPEIGNRPRYIDRRVGRDARWPGGGDHFQFRPAAQRDHERA